MTCPDAATVLEAYVDHELDLSRSLEIEQHLAECARCMDKVRALQQLHARLSSADLRFTAPAALRTRIQRANAIPAYSPRLRPLLVYAAAAVFVLLVFSSVELIRHRDATRELQRDLVAAHVRSLMLNHLMDVQSTDQHTVKPWFQGKLDYSPRVDDLAAEGYPLAGARLDYVAGRTVAVLVYQRRQHPINVFEWPVPEPGDTRPRNETITGFNVVHWRSRGMEFWGISDLNYNELAAFTELLRNRRP